MTDDFQAWWEGEGKHQDSYTDDKRFMAEEAFRAGYESGKRRCANLLADFDASELADFIKNDMS